MTEVAVIIEFVDPGRDFIEPVLPECELFFFRQLGR
jgi:hypothetical protein